MDCVELVHRNGWIILVILMIIGACGVCIHVWWSSRLSFFKFGGQGDATNKGDLKRLLWPLIPVSVLGLFTPIVAVLASSELRDCLKDTTLPDYLSGIWLYILPVVGTGIGVSAVVCAVIGNIFYWIFGLILYLIFRR